MNNVLSPTEKIHKGMRVGSLTVIGVPFWVRIKKNERIRHVVSQCDCGSTCVSPMVQLTRNKKRKTTCGCMIGTQRWRHGGKTTRLYQIFNGMMQRCYNKTRKVYADYGGRGILICDEWYDNFLAFKEWAELNGYEDKLTIERVDNDLGYSPENCRWATSLEQSRNTRKTVLLTAFGETKVVSEWAVDARCKVSGEAVRYRIKNWPGVSGETILTRPARSGSGPRREY